jgi:phosphoribosylformimino-5-aminoimidazole carboxamide ribotide isomerase
MQVIPAIDLMNGEVVRLTRGDPKTKKTYRRLGDPLTVAKRWEKIGASMIHIIDLDAALGQGSNVATLMKILRVIDTPIQFGGGIRTKDIAQNILNLGVKRIILGSMAYNKPDIARILLKTYGKKRVAIALDNFEGQVMIRGWQSPTSMTIEEALLEFSKIGFDLFLVSSIERDGTLRGPDLAMLSKICSFETISIIAAGGISNLEDLLSLKRIGVFGAVVGKALYEGKINLAEALRTVEIN